MIEETEQETKDLMLKSIISFEKKLKRIRTGRANPSILEQIEVDASKSAVKIERIGEIGGTSISINSIGEIELSSLIDHHTKWFNEF